MGSGASKESLSQMTRNGDVTRCMMFGLPGSGKSTFARAARLSEKSGSEELTDVRKAIYRHTVEAMKDVLHGGQRLGLSFTDSRVRKYADIILKATSADHYVSNARLDRKYANALGVLWYERSVQKSYLREDEYGLSETSMYYFRRTRAIIRQDYEPSGNDILHVDFRTTDVETSCFSLGNRMFELIDVPKCKADAKDWSLRQGKVHVMLFFMAISEYDHAQQGQANYFDRSIHYFNSISTLPFLKNALPMIIFSKGDEFARKLRVSPLGDWIPGCSNYYFAESSSPWPKNAIWTQEPRIYIQYRSAYLDISERILKHCRHPRHEEILETFTHLLGPRVRRQYLYADDHRLLDFEDTMNELWGRLWNVSKQRRFSLSGL